MNNRKIVAVIPARYGSTRFEGKPLALIEGRPMIEWVARRVARSRVIDEVVVALDDERVAKACEAAGLSYVMTRAEHTTSTSRLNEVASIKPADLYIAVNGDEPLIEATTVEGVIPATIPDQEPFVANLMCAMHSPAEVVDPTNIKVICNANQEAIYFSRSPIPYPKASLDFTYFKHIGVIAYNRLALDLFCQKEKGKIESIEDINELRFIENGIKIRMIATPSKGYLSVDTPKDLEFVRNHVRNNNIMLD